MRVTIANPDLGSLVRVYTSLGFNGTSNSGAEIFGDCLFCGHRNKLYVNSTTGKFFCHSCSESGNLTSFMTKMWARWREDYPSETWVARVAEHRSLPEDVLLEAGLYFDGERYGFPVRNAQGNVINLRRFHLKDKIKMLGLSLPVFIWGLETMKADSRDVYVVEGEWDCLAMRAMSPEACVLAVPGAGVWKEKWTEILEGRNIFLTYDNDEAGLNGMKRAFELLRGPRKGLKIVKWMDGLKEGYDVRDFYIDSGDQELLKAFYTDKPYWHSGEIPVIDDKPRDLARVFDVFRRWLVVTPEHEEMLKIVLAITLSNRIGGDPVWLYVVGPPGSGKTEVLMSLSGCPGVLTSSSITARGLVSGYRNGVGDPSLIPRLKGNVWILKDFTEVLRQPSASREEVFSILRGAYDGEVVRNFGNGVEVKYVGFFTMIAGVTHAIDGNNIGEVGERFLKYRMVGRGEPSRRAVIKEALTNVGSENSMREELKLAIAEFIAFDESVVEEPEVPEQFEERIVDLAEIISLLRTTVERDGYQRNRISYRPEPEVGTRVSKQLKRILIGLGMLRTPQEILPEDYMLVAKIALHSCIPFYANAIMALLADNGMPTPIVAKKIGLPQETVREILEDLKLVGAVTLLPIDSVQFGWNVKQSLARKWKASKLHTL